MPMPWRSGKVQATKPAGFRAAGNYRGTILIASLAVAVLAVMALLGYLIWAGYREARDEAETKTRNYAAAIEARLDATLRRADAILQERARAIPLAALSKDAVSRYAPEIDAALESQLINFPELGGVRVFDADGDRLYATASDATRRTHVSDRGYFRQSRDNPQAGLVFSDVIVSRTTGRLSMPISKALRDAQGAFRGIVTATIELEFFQKLFQSLDLGAKGVVAIYRLDNFTPVVRWPVVDSKIDTPLPPGNPASVAFAHGAKTATVEFSSSTDGITRIYSFHALDRYPFFVTAGLARDEVLAGWQARALAVGLSGLLLLGLLASLLFVLWRGEMRQARAMASMMESEERFRATFELAAVGIAHTTPDKRYLMVNQKFCDMLGYTRDELLAMRTDQLPHPDDRGDYTDMKRLLAGEIDTYSGEKRYLRKDGSILWVNRTVSLARDHDGKPLYLIRVTEDINERRRAQETQARLAAIVASSNDAIVSRGLDDKILSWNPGAERLFGYTADDAIGQSISMIFPADREHEIARNRALLAQGIAVHDLETERLAKGGQRVAVSLSQSPITDERGLVTGVSLVFRDIRERKQMDLRQSMEHTVTRILAESGTLAEAAPMIIQTICETMGWDCGGRWEMDKEAGVLRCIEYWGVDTPEIREFTAANANRTVSPQARSGRGLVRRIYNTGLPQWIADISQEPGLLRTSMVVKAGLHGAFGFPLLLGGEVLGLMEFFHREVREPDAMLLQIAESLGNQIGQFIARKRAEERIGRLANYDALTGLPNRSLFHERLHHALTQAQRHARPLAVLFIDLDQFKKINDTLGHEAGDRVLKDVAERLRGCLRASDTAGRLGGDEFVVLVEEIPQPSYVAAVAQKILSAVARPFILDGQDFHLAASIGISTYPTDSEDMPSLLRNADIAMYRAKEGGRNNFQFYSAQMNVHTLERLALESDLRRAVARHEFVLHYQPKFDILSGHIIGMEALVRWQHPTQGLIPPAQFISLAEETGLIVPIGAWVINTACARNQAWQDQGLPALRIAVNLSARQFAHESLVQDVSRVLAETGLDPATLEFEITESMVMHNPEQAVNLLTQLKAMGIQLAIDDFGTGYSSLSYLKRFPIDSVKVDRSFIKDLPGNSDDAAITRAIIAMAHSLKLKVIAEGVETEEQLGFLRDHACDEMQGYYFSNPLPEGEFVGLVQSGFSAGTAASPRQPAGVT